MGVSQDSGAGRKAGLAAHAQEAPLVGEQLLGRRTPGRMTVQPARLAQLPPPRSRAERPRASQSKRALSHLTTVSLIQPSALVNESDAGVCPVSSSRPQRAAVTELHSFSPLPSMLPRHEAVARAP